MSHTICRVVSLKFAFCWLFSFFLLPGMFCGDFVICYFVFTWDVHFIYMLTENWAVLLIKLLQLCGFVLFSIVWDISLANITTCSESFGRHLSVRLNSNFLVFLLKMYEISAIVILPRMYFDCQFSLVFPSNFDAIKHALLATMH